MKVRIEPWQSMSFEALSSGNSEAFELIPCIVGDEASAAIVFLRRVPGGYEGTPLFVAVTPGMKLLLPGDTTGDGGEGGPRREGTAGAFDAAKSIMTAAYGS